jgi:DNA-binding MarR family transcriptional regulator
MAGIHTFQVLEHSQSTGAARLIMLVLAAYSSPDPRTGLPLTCISTRRIADAAALSRSTVQRSLSALEALGEVSRRIGEHGRGVYLLTLKLPEYRMVVPKVAG